MTAKERALLKRLAEAYAFILDLRETAKARLDTYYVQRTEGIEKRVAITTEQYPKTFSRHFNKVRKNNAAQ